MAKYEPVEIRFWRLVDKTILCWIWTGALNERGYGRFHLSGNRSVRAHRFAYELFKGAIPKGCELDHLCGTRACVNPEHLEAVVHRTNLLRGATITARNAAVTHCPKGHPYTEANTYRKRSNNGRNCRTCQSQSERLQLLVQTARRVLLKETFACTPSAM
jgi:hypothetical protein